MNTQARQPLRPIQNQLGRKSELPGRRQTITNSASAKPRISLAPNVNPRVSLAPNQLQSELRRQSSIGVNNMRSKDPRVDDPKYLQATKKRIIEFLVEYGYSLPIAEKIITHPSVKDFHEIMLFLIKSVDPVYEWKGPPEEEIAKFFKQMHYPFSINKSSLKSIGSKTAWTQVLLAIGWLVDLLRYDIEVNSQQKGYQLEEDMHESLFFDFLGLAYQQFLQGKNAPFGDLEAKLANLFQEKNQIVVAQTRAIQEENDELVAQIQQLQQEKNRIPQLEQEIKIVKQDMTKFEEMIDKWQTYCNDLEEQSTSLYETLQALKKDLEDAELDQQNVVKRLEKQDMTSEDVQKLLSERSRCQQELQVVVKLHQTLQDQSSGLEKQLEAMFNDIQPLIRTYNETATEMKLIPKTAKYSDGFDYEVTLHLRDLHDDSSIDMKRDIKINLLKLRESFKQRLIDANEKCVELQNLNEQESEKLQDKMDEINEIQRKLAELNERIKADKQLIVEEYEDTKVLTLQCREKTARLEQTSQEELNKSVNYLQRVKAASEQHAAQTVNSKMLFASEYQNLLTLVMNHKAHLRERLDKLHDTCKHDLFP